MRRNGSRIILVLALAMVLGLMLAAPGAWAADYYVDSKGNDKTGNGTLAKPWKTPSYACRRAFTPGDIIHIAPGTYRDNTQCNLAPGVSFLGAGRDKTIIMSSSFNWYIWAVSKSIVDGNQTIKGFRLDGMHYLLSHGINVTGRNNVTVEDIEFLHIEDMALKMQGVEWWEGADWSWRQGSMPPGWATNCIIRNVRTEACARGTLDGAIWVTTLQDSLLEGLEVDESAAVGGRGSGLKSWPGFLRHTIIRNSRFLVDPRQEEPMPLEVWDWMQDCEVYGNLFKGGYLSLVSGNKWGGTWALDFHHNTIDGTGVQGAGHELALSDVDFHHNLLMEYGLSIWATGHGWTANHAGLSNVRIRNNIIRNGAPVGIYIMNGPGPDNVMAGPMRNISVVNNVIDGTRNIWGSRDGVYVDNKGPYAIEGVSICNNVMQDMDRAVVLTDFITGAVVSTNDFFRTCPIYSIATDYTAVGNLAVDPLFRLAGTSPDQYYAPLPGSPLIDAGSPVGLPYQGTAPDIGAVESGAP